MFRLRNRSKPLKPRPRAKTADVSRTKTSIGENKDSIEKLKRIKQELLKDSEIEVEMLAKKIAMIDKAREETVRTAEDLMRKTKMLNLANVEREEKEEKRDRTGKKVSQVLTDPSKLPFNFFQDTMIETLNEKWQKKKFSIADKEKMDMLKQKYEHVQTVINKIILGNMKKNSPKEQGTRDNHFSRLGTQDTTTRFSRLGTIQKNPIALKEKSFGRQRSQIERSRRFNSESIDSDFSGTDHMMSTGSPKESKSPNFEEYINSTLSKFVRTDQATSTLREKIDSIYLTFAATEGFSDLYMKKRQELCQENEHFKVGVGDLRHFEELSDNFIDGREMDQLPHNILTNPFALTYLETNKQSFYHIHGHQAWSEEDEEELDKLIEERVPENMKHLRPKLKNMIKNTVERDKHRVQVEQIANMNQIEGNPREDKWKLNLFFKTKVDRNLVRADFPKRKQQDKGNGLENDKSSAHKFIKEKEAVGKYTSADYFYKHSELKKPLPLKQESFLMNTLLGFTGKQAKQGFVSQTQKIEEELDNEKQAVKKKIASLYTDLDAYQKTLRKERCRLIKSEKHRQKEEREVAQLQDVSQAVTKLIKESIVESYELVKNNKRASTIKMYVCSAENYLKKTKRI